MLFPVHFAPLFPHTCAIKLHWNLVHRSHFSTFHLILKATWLICYCILSGLLPPFWFSAKLTKGYIYKSVNVLNSFIPYHQISSYLPTLTKFTKFLLYHWKLKKKYGNIEQKQLQEMKCNRPTMWTCLIEFIKSQIFFHISVQQFWFSFLLFCWCSSLKLLYSTRTNFAIIFLSMVLWIKLSIKS